jgi:glutamine synthetase
MNPMATRFELRSPNPKSNTYMVLATGFMAMLDGIKAALGNEKTPKELEASISKKSGEEDFYLETEREYRSEKNVFEDYTDEERNKLFGVPPRTVWQNLKSFDLFPEKVKAVSDGIMDEQILDSYRTCITNEWSTEYHFRNIPNAMHDIKDCKMIHGSDATDFDEANWEEINRLRFEIAKDSSSGKSLLTRAREALDRREYDEASELQITIQAKVEELKKKYADYKRNLF